MKQAAVRRQKAEVPKVAPLSQLSARMCQSNSKVLSSKDQFPHSYQHRDWDNLLLKNHKTGQILNYSYLKSNSIIAETDSNFFILEHEIKELADAVYLLPKFSQAQPELFPKAEEGRYLAQFVVGGDYFFVKYIVDATSILKVYNRKAEYIDGIVISPELSLDEFS